MNWSSLFAISRSHSSVPSDPENEGIWADIGDVETDIIVIAVVSSVLLLFSVQSQFKIALISSRFYAWYPEIYGDSWLMFLLECWFSLSLYIDLYKCNSPLSVSFK